jgi:hypothetical protein
MPKREGDPLLGLTSSQVSDLRSVFSSFAQFGHDRVSAASSAPAGASLAAEEPTLDCARFAKLCRDSRLLDAQLITPQAVDIVFAKAKGAPRERRLRFDRFRHALALLAEVKFGANPDGPAVLAAQVLSAASSLGGGPQLDAVHLPQTSHNIFERLTDSRLYVGTHKERFDHEGRGRGVEGRERVSVGAGTVDLYTGGNVSDLSSIVRPGFRGGTHMNPFARQSASANLPSASPNRVETRTWSPPGKAAAAAGARPVATVSLAQVQSDAQRREAELRAQPPQLPPYRELAPQREVPGEPSLHRYPSPTHSMDSNEARPSTAVLPHWQRQLDGFGDLPAAPNSSSSSSYFPAARSGYEHGARPRPPKVVIESAELEAIFASYCAFGTTAKLVRELDNARFAKLCRETGLVDGRQCKAADADLAFAKVRAASSAEAGVSRRTLAFDDFCQALAIIAPLRFPGDDVLASLQAAVEQIIVAGGPAVLTSSIAPAAAVFDRLKQR